MNSVSKYSVNNQIAIDSNCLTYLYNSIQPSFDIDRDPAKAEIIAIYKILLCVVLVVLPSVKNEMEKINNEAKHQGHWLLSHTLIRTIYNLDKAPILNRTEYYKQYHRGAKEGQDCQILAEAELGGMDFLLTNDTSFLGKLQNRSTSVFLLKPSVYFERLKVNSPNGIEAKIEPIPGVTQVNPKIWQFICQEKSLKFSPRVRC